LGCPRAGRERYVARVLTGPARCTECRAVWRAVHLVSTGEECIRCGGKLELLEPADTSPRFRDADAPRAPRFAHLRTGPWGSKRANRTPESQDPERLGGLGS
jgi:hypothetical protein